MARCVLTGLEESCVTGVCQQAGCSWGDDGSRDFTPARPDTYQRSHVAHTGVLCSHWRRVRMLLTFSTFVWRQLNQSCIISYNCSHVSLAFPCSDPATHLCDTITVTASLLRFSLPCLHLFSHIIIITSHGVDGSRPQGLCIREITLKI